MTTNQIYSIATHYQRSVRIDADLTPDFFDGFVFHGTAQQTLNTLCAQFKQAEQKAFTITGAYGSGKSSIALLIAGLLNNNSTIQHAARAAVNRATQSSDRSLDLFDKSLENKKGWVLIRAVGGIESPVDCLWNATIKGLKDHPHLADVVKKYAKYTPATENDLLACWLAIFEILSTRIDGVLILADEMGKMLDFINKNHGDMHLFQEIGEQITRLTLPVLFIGLLHQSFREYAKGRSSKKQEEWAKIQGRYSDILFNVTTDETVALISSSINVNSELIEQHHIANNAKLVDVTISALKCDNVRKEMLRERLLACSPFHPLTTLLLGPLAKRSFSQNERSTFGFLNSHEPFGFNSFLKNNSEINNRYKIHNLWDYLEANLQFAILSSRDGHAWSQASDAIDRVTRMANEEIIDMTFCVNLLKTIAIINLFGRAAQMFATQSILAVAMECSEEELKIYLNYLARQSVVIHRKYEDAWMIFEGSDLNIDALVHEKIQQIDSDAKVVEHIAYSDYVMAKRHYHETGTIRWVKQGIVFGSDKLEEFINKNQTGAVFANFVLLLDPSLDEQDLLELTTTRCHDDLALASTKYSDDILEIARDIYALDLIKLDKDVSRALQSDKIASREFNTRYAYTRNLLRERINFAFRELYWITNKGKERAVYQISQIASDMADDMFKSSPIILNELVNRGKLSANAVSASKKLLERMVESDGLADLGIDGFPPEKAIYMSLLKQKQLHITDESNNWVWNVKHAELPDKGLRTVFLKTTELLKGKSTKLIPVEEIFNLWSMPPFGLMDGVLPILFLAYAKSLVGNIAFYEKALSGDFEYLAEVDIDYVHKLQKSPKELAIKYFIVNAEEQAWLDKLGVLSSELAGKRVENNFIGIATPMVTKIQGLPHWVKHTNNLDMTDDQFNRVCRNVRDAFLRANDPLRLITVELPQALDPDHSIDDDEKVVILYKVFDVLNNANNHLLENFKNKISAVLPINETDFTMMCDVVHKKAADWSLKTFSRELSKCNSTSNDWITSIITVLSGTMQHSWNEHVLKKADNALAAFVSNFFNIYNAYKSDLHDKAKTSSSSGNMASVSLRADSDGKNEHFKKLNSMLSSMEVDEQIDVLQRLLAERIGK